MKTVQVTFDYEDFNTSTRRDTDMRRHGMAEVKQATGGGVYVWGSLGCGKTRDSVGDALNEYLGGRTLLAYRIWD